MTAKETLYYFKIKESKLADAMRFHDIEDILIKMLNKVNEKDCMGCESSIPYSSGVFYCEDCIKCNHTNTVRTIDQFDNRTKKCVDCGKYDVK